MFRLVIFRSSVALLFTIGIASRGASEETASAPVNIDEQLATIVASTRVPGMVALVLKGDRTIAQGAAGVRKRGSLDFLRTDDRFLLCSAGKAMTSTLAAMAVDEGRISWTTNLGGALPEIT